MDQDTAGIAGWPDIASTILTKIEKCEVFVADLTPINGPEPDSRPTPNPNVMLELGYASWHRDGADPDRLRRQPRLSAQR